MPNSTQTILSVERALLILKHLASSGEEIGVRDLSRGLGYSPAVTQKILNTLKAHSYVRQSEDTERYSLGLGALQLGMAVLARLDVAEVARPYVESLTLDTGETTFLAIRDSSTAIYVDKQVSHNPIHMDAPVGAKRPLNCTAVGKVLLAFSNESVFEKALDAKAFTKETQKSITDPKALREELSKVRKQGYAVDHQEFHPEAICIAAPIFAPNGQIVATITTSGVAYRLQDKIEEVAEIVMDKATRISEELGYSYDQKIHSGSRDLNASITRRLQNS
ncbi:MAG: IclR family transcriptional regulator [Anaerolineales bacterium]|jgi:IclR family KDG regulon transcriptional repressor